MYKLLSSKKIIKTLMKHGSKKEIPRGTLASILRQSGLQKEDFLIDN
jgi:predicted RNA binding protein YcfA (HicA-like mRNA interferase family)